MRAGLVIMLCLAVILSSGCWDLQIVEELALAFALGIDPSPDDPDLMRMSMTNPVFSEYAESPTSKFVVEGSSLSQIFHNIQRQRSHTLVFGQVNVLVFSEEAARSGLMNWVMQEVDQQRDMNPNANLTIVRGATAQEVVYLEPPQDARLGIYLTNLFNRNFNNGLIPQITASRYWFKYTTAGVDPVVPIIELTGLEGEEDGVTIAGLAAFDSQGRMKGSLTDHEILHYLLLTSHMRRGRFTSKLEIEGAKRDISFLVKDVSTKFKTSVENNRPRIAIKMDVDMDVINVHWGTDTLDEEVETLLETLLAQDIQGNAMDMLRKTQRWGTDIIGIGRYMRVQNPHWFRDRDWTEDYKESHITMEVNVNIRRIGTLLNPHY